MTDRLPTPTGEHRSLAGIRVVDLSRALAGPYATMMLADVGADVLKVEPPTGDDSRGWLPFASDEPGAESAYFLSANRGKRSVRLDLKSAEGAERLRRCAPARTCSWRTTGPGCSPGSASTRPTCARPTRGWSRCRSPASAPAAPTAPARLRPDRAGRGGADEPHRPGDGDPTRVGLPIADILAGMFGAFGVMSALRERERTGVGRAVETSLLAAVTSVHAFHGAGWLTAGVDPGRTGNRHPRSRPTGRSAAPTPPW